MRFLEQLTSMVTSYGDKVSRAAHLYGDKVLDISVEQGIDGPDIKEGLCGQPFQKITTFTAYLHTNKEFSACAGITSSY